MRFVEKERPVRDNQRRITKLSVGRLPPLVISANFAKDHTLFFEFYSRFRAFFYLPSLWGIRFEAAPKIFSASGRSCAAWVCH